MVVGEIAEPVDLLVIGAGPGGYVAAVRAAELGREVVVAERGGAEGGLGGACLHVGCIPSKALIELAQARQRTETMAAAGLRVEAGDVDLAAFQDWKGSIVEGLADGVERLFERHGVRTIEGTARFAGRDRVAVTMPDGSGRFLEFQDAILAAGSRPIALPKLPFDGDRVLSSTGALALDAVPSSLAIVGAGYVGLELGIAFAKLGADVTVVEALDRVLPSVDVTLTKPVIRRLGELGIELLLGSRVERLHDDGLVVEGSDGERTLAPERVIVAVGRAPNTQELGLEAADLRVDDQGLIAVDNRRLAAPHIAAIGDLTAGPALAHKASAEAKVAAEALCGRPAAFDPMAVPVMAFTDPEIASAGLTEAQAREAGLDVAVGSSSFTSNGRAATLGEPAGFIRTVVDRSADRIVGVHAVGPHASELIAEATLAIEMVASPEDVLGTIHAHPTLSEGLPASLAQVDDRPRAADAAPEEVANVRR
jgi:dihydrolipoamide dehydrogenase